MKKHLLLIGTLAITLVSAQNNDALKREFERQNKENSAKFDSYVAKRYGANKSPEVLKEIEEQRANLAGFSGDVPNFYKADDQNQILNNNVDALTTAGGVNGLTGAFKGENIKYTIFDGGRIYAAHTAFNNAAGRITNLEAATNAYSAHSTGVASIIGAKSSPLSATSNGVQITGNAMGIALNSTMDSYRFATTTLPGNTTTSTVFDKIIAAQPKISNHSYGVNAAWDYKTTADGYPVNGWYWGGNYISGNNYDLMGTYYGNDQNYDAIVYNNPSYTIVKSAGNYFDYGPGFGGTSTTGYYYNGTGFTAYPDGLAPPTNCSQGFDCIGYGSLAKNIIVVGATDIITTNNYRYQIPDDVMRSSYSSAGPRDDGGIKPDIAAPGTDIWMASTAENTTGSVAWQINSGTSMSAPQVTGIIGLWMQIYKSLFNNAELNAAAAKTLMVHSASEAGNVGPDPWYGWGYINAKKGAELLVGKSNNTIIFNNETLTSGTPNKKVVKATGTEPLKVTISWIDPEYVVSSNLWSDLYNNRVSRLVNDLDLRIIDTVTNTVYYPWKLNATSPMTPATKADNTVDNVEQVVIDAPVAGRNYRIEISNKGTLKNNTGANAPQNYSIITTGYTEQVLGTGEIAKDGGITIAPTLTKDFVKVLKAPKKSTFNVYELSGKKLQSGVINSDEASVDLSSYTKGIYIIEVKTDKDTVSKKVIKE
ncbi:Por secretion system C-terminal sorting domain-containing protein [Chryseobacterium soldanellicola]|uniref:Por secretion system C-terminal sorting domain-containing protein n=1 Tax=Chryseobacterium soldanellicola TaxID=311333 RepID=A0A1H0XXS8_9FLAO|nr:S8 family peptidase [Chryseobacterium soldanellicola]SDQ07466.1 Por secretion system C-terminal sorting domain-containing protein [Chryseobacterium soldanellicola]